MNDWQIRFFLKMKIFILRKCNLSVFILKSTCLQTSFLVADLPPQLNRAGFVFFFNQIDFHQYDSSQVRPFHVCFFANAFGIAGHVGEISKLTIKQNNVLSEKSFLKKYFPKLPFLASPQLVFAFQDASYPKTLFW